MDPVSDRHSAHAMAQVDMFAWQKPVNHALPARRQIGARWAAARHG
jgi:hypothetical protein